MYLVEDDWAMLEVITWSARMELEGSVDEEEEFSSFSLTSTPSIVNTAARSLSLCTGFELKELFPSENTEHLDAFREVFEDFVLTIEDCLPD